jgi:hypothetical protein
MSMHINGMPIEVFRQQIRFSKAKNITGDADLIIGASQPLDDQIKFNVNPVTGTIEVLTSEVPSVSVVPMVEEVKEIVNKGEKDEQNV